MFGGFLMDPKLAERIERENEERRKQRFANARDWDPNMRWKQWLDLRASTYKPLRLFPNIQPIPPHPNNPAHAANIATSPDGRWGYAELLLPAGHQLAIWQGSKRGSAMFDGAVAIPAIYERRRGANGQLSGWHTPPWMSLTPNEILTLRPGTKLASGSVVVAGLGLGHQLIEVSKRKQVTHLTLIERDRDLVDWLLPVIRPHLGRTLDEVIVGNVYEELPKLERDVALVDVFPDYGNNGPRTQRLRASSPKIGKVWGWGTAVVRRQRGD